MTPSQSYQKLIFERLSERLFEAPFSMAPVIVLVLLVVGNGGGDGSALLVLEVLLLVVVAVRCRKLIRTLSWTSGGPRCVFIMVDERLV